LFDRKVVGWSMSKGLSAGEATISARRMAVQNRPVQDKLIFHTDSGIQHACSVFVNVLSANKWVCRACVGKGIVETIRLRKFF